MPFSNHQFSLRCLFSWEVPQIDCCQCLSRDQYRFKAILKNDTGKEKKNDALFAAHPHISIFFSDFCCLLPSLMLGNSIFWTTKYPHQKPGDEEFSFYCHESLVLQPQNSCLGKSSKNLPLLRRKFGQSEPRSQEIRKRSSWEKAKASIPWSCSSRGDVWSS